MLLMVFYMDEKEILFRVILILGYTDQHLVDGTEL